MTTTFLSSLPRWLSGLLTEKFFNACIIHEDAKKNEKNHFCIACCVAICPHCKPLHHTHDLLQIRRYVYCDVGRLEDLEKLLDCSSIQYYITNGAKVVYLKPRDTPSGRYSGPACTTCERSLRERYSHCSLSCKLQHILQSGEKLSDYVHKCEDVNPPETVVEESRWTPSSILVPMRSCSNSSVGGGMSCLSLACTATTDAVVRKKRTTVVRFRPPNAPVAEKSNRRKGTPRRAPFGLSV